MRHRSEAAQGWIRGRFKTDFVPPAISPVITLLAAFEACYRRFFAPVSLSRPQKVIL